VASKLEKIMSQFEYGHWDISIEKHGRLKLPVSLLKSLPEDQRQKFWVTHGFGKYVSLWTEFAYRKQIDFMNTLDKSDPEVKRYIYAFLRNTAFVECDTQDRFVIPKPLLEHYNIDKDAVLLLVNGKIDVWNAENYYAKYDISPEDLENLDNRMHNNKQYLNQIDKE